MALVNPFIFQIVGYQNSRKTTLMKRLIHELSQDGIKVATIKHHGHGGKPFVDEAKDSALHVNAGASCSIVEGEGRLILQGEKHKWTLVEQIELLSFFKPDVILIEGHKYAHYQKAVLLRNDDDLNLLADLNNIKVVYYLKESLANFIPNWIERKSFHMDDKKGTDFLVQYIKDRTVQK